MVPVSLRAVRTTLRVTCGTRRARALPQTFRGDVGRSRGSKVRARPTRQLHRVVSGPVQVCLHHAAPAIALEKSTVGSRIVHRVSAVVKEGRGILVRERSGSTGPSKAELLASSWATK